MKKLKDFPLIEIAFKTIEMDQHRPGAYIIMNAKVPPHWIDHFEITESVLAKLAETPIGQLPKYKWFKDELSISKEENDFDVDKEKAMYFFVMPVDDDDKVIGRMAEIPLAEVLVACNVLYQFFEGDLREVFQGVRNSRAR